MIDITPTEVVRDMEEAASSSKSLKRFPLFVDFLCVLHIFEKLNEAFKFLIKISTNLDSDFVNAIFFFWILVFG